ncbi:MAG: thioredoxin domain-containing protein [Spirochaetales bacterium]|nr:thioredoxin domain-containing protein [Spirochaetales bacterium]
MSSAKPNRLIHEASPYLLQHAYNPVDWFPWGQEAFSRARELDRPVFLSIGYATCHWCHVMEHESFENPAVADLMNQTCINIKLDREERPDIDQIYMAACQILNGNGGWPLTIIMTPEARPFFVATYIPPGSRHGRMGMLELLPRIGQAWKEQRAEMERVAAEIEKALHNESRQETTPFSIRGQNDVLPILQQGYEQLKSRYDSEYGGFSSAPKFPTPHNCVFLLQYHLLDPGSNALQMVEKTLQSMRAGGIFDQVGLGFHRYSTDREWLLPHFEKMLYDQALLAIAFTDAYQLTGKPFYAGVVAEIFNYTALDLSHPDGGFFSAEDADSEGEEGKFYVWTQDELESLLGSGTADFCNLYGVMYDGNFHDEATHARSGQNILHLPADFFADPENSLESMAVQREILRTARIKRIRPLLDDKILTDWNGLMISALARAGRTLQKVEYLERARKALDFVHEHLRLSDGRLLHRFRNGQAGIGGFLDDYVFLTRALLDYYEASAEVWAFKQARELADWTIQLFGDPDGAFFFTATDGERLLVRKKEFYDGAVPSGNAVAISNFLRLYHLSGHLLYEETAHRVRKEALGLANRYPSAYTELLQALIFEYGDPAQVVIVAPDASDARKLLNQFHRRRFPACVTLFLCPENAADLIPLSHIVTGKVAVENRTTFYVCRNFTCQAPVMEAKEALDLLGRKV